MARVRLIINELIAGGKVGGTDKMTRRFDKPACECFLHTKQAVRSSKTMSMGQSLQHMEKSELYERHE